MFSGKQHGNFLFDGLVSLLMAATLSKLKFFVISFLNSLLMRARVTVEIEWIIALSEFKTPRIKRTLSREQKNT